MTIDFLKCRIITPKGDLALKMHKDLWEIFPYDRPVYDEIMNNNKKLYSVINYALFMDEEFIGNAGLFPVKIWYKGKIAEMIGLGAVATMPQYRKQGVARYLMKHCMEQLDKENKPSILFTELPAVYEDNGYKVVDQDYQAVNAADLNFKNTQLNFEFYQTIEYEQLQVIKNFYNNRYPNYDGKIVRTDAPDYWDFYMMMFNPYIKPRLVIATDDSNKCCGYSRFEVESDRLTITEFCTEQDDFESCKAILSFVDKFARSKSFDIITIPISKDNCLWNLLKELNIQTFTEPKGVRREVFMVRPAKSQKNNTYNDLLWSLADKF